MTKKYNILGKYIKDLSSETPNVETYLFVRDYISSYQLGIDITSKALKDKLIEIGIYSTSGQLIDYKNISLPINNRNYRLQTENYKQGVYIIKVTGATLDQSIQVIKKW